MNARLDLVRAGAAEIRKTIADMEIHPDARELIDCMEKRGEWREELAKATGVVHALRVGQAALREVEMDFEEAIDELRDYMTASGMDTAWDDHGNIARFLRE